MRQFMLSLRRMSFKRYLIATFSAVLLALFGLFWWLVDNLTDEIDRKISNSVGVASQQAIIMLVGAGRTLLPLDFTLNPQPGSSVIEITDLRIEGLENSTAPISQEQLEEIMRLLSERTGRDANGKPLSPNGEIARLTFGFDVDAAAGTLTVHTPKGSQVVELPETPIQSSLEELRRNLLIGGSVLFSALIGLGIWMAHHISQPIRQLGQAADRVGHGELGYQLPRTLNSWREIEQLGAAFNRMSTHLQELDALKTRMEQSQQLNELGEIAKGFAHTIRNPLNTIGLAMEQLASKDLSDDQKNALAATASQQIRQVDQWIQSFLMLAAGSAEMDESVDLRELCLAVELECQNALDKNVGFQFEFEGDTEVTGNRNELKSMLHTLMVNAYEASPDGDEVGVCIAGGEQQLSIEVRDRGAGISDELANRLFEPHITSKAHGAGMGLYISRRIARSRYRGDLTLVNAEPGALASLVIHRHRSLSDA